MLDENIYLESSWHEYQAAQTLIRTMPPSDYTTDIVGRCIYQAYIKLFLCLLDRSNIKLASDFDLDELYALCCAAGLEKVEGLSATLKRAGGCWTTQSLICFNATEDVLKELLDKYIYTQMLVETALKRGDVPCL